MPLHSFSSFISRPPTSTLFPYTTLFRSFDWGLRNILHYRRRQRCFKTLVVFQSDLKKRRFELRTRLLSNLVVANLKLGEDRKSTRLNSSHTVISYAVFCLKKKKKKHREQ